MCGIAGFIGKGTEGDIQKMTTSLSHRGPDASGFFERSSVRFGHRRLTIQETVLGQQPMRDRSGLTVVFNGEIYNYPELRKELEGKGYVFREGHSDTEVLLHGYRAWGEGLPLKLNGMWAFAIFDEQASKVFLSRDRFGQKPLFYSKQNGTFAFASEIRALQAHSNLKFDLSRLGVKKYLAHGYMPFDTTIYAQISKLPAGHSMVVNTKDLSHKISQYWRYSIVPDESKSEKYWIDLIHDQLRDSVKRHLISDVPLGVFLSGGLDSSSVLAFARQALGKDAPIHSYSVAFDEPSFDETPLALEASKLFGTTHKYEMFDREKLDGLMKELFSHLDEPISDSSMMSYFLLCRFASKAIKVAVGGDAGDELLAGYDTFQALKMARVIEPLCPRPVHKGILAAVSRMPAAHGYMPLHFKLQRLFKGFGHSKSLWNPLWLGPLSTTEISDIMQEPVGLEELYSEAIEMWDSSEAKNEIDRALEFYGRLFLTDQILVKVDRMSMAHSLEVRVPFLDVELVNTIMQMPNRFKLKGLSTGKYVLKKAVKAELPHSLIWRKKVGFGAPLTKWFADGSIVRQEPLAALPGKGAAARNAIQDTISAIGYRKFVEHKAGADNRMFLWNTMVLESVLKRADG